MCNEQYKEPPLHAPFTSWRARTLSLRRHDLVSSFKLNVSALLFFTFFCTVLSAIKRSNDDSEYWAAEENRHSYSPALHVMVAAY